MQDFLGLTLNALMVAGLYATMSYGLALIYGVMKIINLAHAGIMMLAVYITYTLFTALGMDPLLSIVVVVPLFFLVGMLLFRFLVSRLPAGAGGPSVQSLLLLFGVWLVLQNIAYFIWTGDTRSIMTGYTLKTLEVAGVAIAYPKLAVFIAGIVALVVLQVMLSRTYMGKAIRAVSQNPTSATLVGINTSRIATLAFGIGTAFAALAGSLMTVLYAFNPDFGRNFLLKSFSIIVLGGMESFTGVAVGAVVLALIENYAVAAGIPNTLQDFITFALLVVALVVMPQGLPGLWQRLAALRPKGVAR